MIELTDKHSQEQTIRVFVQYLEANTPKAKAVKIKLDKTIKNLRDMLIKNNIQCNSLVLQGIKLPDEMSMSVLYENCCSIDLSLTLCLK